eukprot:UN05168
MDESEQSADFSQTINSGWAGLWWVTLHILLLVVLIMPLIIAISVLICFGCYEYKKYQNAKWIISPSCSSVSSPSCASNFDVNDNQADCDEKETDRQLEQWVEETR